MIRAAAAEESRECPPALACARRRPSSVWNSVDYALVLAATLALSALGFYLSTEFGDFIRESRTAGDRLGVASSRPASDPRHRRENTRFLIGSLKSASALNPEDVERAIAFVSIMETAPRPRAAAKTVSFPPLTGSQARGRPFAPAAMGDQPRLQ